MESKSKSSFWQRSKIYVLVIFIVWTGLSYLCDHSEYRVQMAAHTVSMVERIKKVDSLYLATTFFSRLLAEKSGWDDLVWHALSSMWFTAQQAWESGWEVIIPGFSSLVLATFGLSWIITRVRHRTARKRDASLAGLGSNAGASAPADEFAMGIAVFGLNAIVFWICVALLLGALLQFAFKWLLVGVLDLFGIVLAWMTWVAYVLAAIETYLRFRHAEHLVKIIEPARNAAASD